MTNNFTSIMKNVWKISKSGLLLFISGMILFIVDVIYSIIWRVNFSSSPDEISYIVTIIGIGIPFVLAGINMILNPVKENPNIIIRGRDYLEDFMNYVKGYNMLLAGLTLSIMFIIFFFMSYPDGWYYPNTYIVYIFYMIGISMLIVDTFSNAANVIEKLGESNRIIKQKEDMCKEETIPDYITEFANNIKKDIDDAVDNLSERTVSSIKKYRLDNEQLHIDVQNFRQRIEKEKGDSKKYANERIIKNLMKMLHSIDYTLKYKDNKDINNMINDVEGIKKDLNNIIKDEEVEIIDPSVGDDFDDTKCCAVQVIETDKSPNNKIMEVKKLGYRFKSGKVICADVVVSKNNSKQKPIIDKDNKDDNKDDKNKDKKADKDKPENMVNKDDNKVDKNKDKPDKVNIGK